MYAWFAKTFLFRLQESMKRHPTFHVLGEMERAEKLSVEQFQELQNRKLQDLIEYCYTHVPYVRNQMDLRNIRPEQIRRPADLALLPVSRKTDIRRGRELLRSDCTNRLPSFSTGGSTGEPLIFEIGKRRIASRVACRLRANGWWGLSVGDPELAIWGSPLELTHQDWIRKLRDRLLRSRLLSAYELNEDSMARYIALIQQGHWRQIFAYPSAMYTLCLYARKKGVKLSQCGIKVIFVTSEMLYPHQRLLISETFGCPVANGYGGRDSGFIAHECPQGAMHIMADTVIVEVVDQNDQPLGPGLPGELVVTDLYSHEFPFIRYATGDRGILGVGLCSCGRPLPLLERLDGRSNDSLTTPDGRVMHGQSFISLLMEIPGIEQFRIHQQTVTRYHVQLVRSPTFPSDGEARIRSAWAERLRSQIDVEFEYVHEIPVERSGKHRHIVSDVDFLSESVPKKPMPGAGEAVSSADGRPRA